MNLSLFSVTKILLLICAITYCSSSFGQSKPDNAYPDTATVACGCPKIGYINPGYPFFNGLSSYTHYSSLEDATGWVYSNKKATFDTLFTKNVYSYSTTYSGFSTGDMTVISPRQPIRLVHPGNTFTINFTPCKNINGIYELLVNITYDHPILKDIRDFDLQKFDHTTLSYVKLLLKLSEKRPDQLIRDALKNRARKSDGGVELNRSITVINRYFKTGIPLVSANNLSDTTWINAVLDSLVSKKVRQADVLSAAFIQSVPGHHKITNAEGSELSYLFYNYYYPINAGVEEFEKNKLNPHIDARIDQSLIKLEISPAILSQAGAKQPAYIWGNVADIRYSFENELQMNFTSVCIPKTLIAGTNINIVFTDATLISGQKQHEEKINYAMFPQFAVDIPKNTKAKQPGGKLKYDSLFTNFTGVMVKNATFTMLNGSNKLTLPATDVIINNKLISGHVALRISPLNLNAVTVGSDHGEKIITINDLLALLKKERLGGITTKMELGQFNIYFKKIAP